MSEKFKIIRRNLLCHMTEGTEKVIAEYEDIAYHTALHFFGSFAAKEAEESGSHIAVYNDVKHGRRINILYLMTPEHKAKVAYYLIGRKERWCDVCGHPKFFE